MKVGLGRVWGLRSIAGSQSYAERRSGSALDHAKHFSYWRFMRIDLNGNQRDAFYYVLYMTKVVIC